MEAPPFSSWPHYEQDELDAVDRVLRSGKVNYWTGEEGRAFEQEFAAYCGVEYGVALSNGTVALEMALHAAGIVPGDEVIVTPRTFFASASSIVRVGAVPIFADVDRDSQNITAETIQQVLTENTRGIVAVHLAGYPCEMDPIMELAKQHGLVVVEDCAQAHGAIYRGKKVGSIGDVAAFSFCQDKIISTGGEGGMVVTNNRAIWSRVWSNKDHGKSWETVYHRNHPPGFRWLHESFGTNGRMTEMQAAIGRLQLEKLEQRIEKRQQHAQQMNQAVDSLTQIWTASPPDSMRHVYYKYYLFSNHQQSVIQRLNQNGVPAMVGSCSELYREKAFTSLVQSHPTQPLPVARELGDTAIMIPVDHTIAQEKMDHACQLLSEMSF